MSEYNELYLRKVLWDQLKAADTFVERVEVLSLFSSVGEEFTDTEPHIAAIYSRIADRARKFLFDPAVINRDDLSSYLR